MKVLVTGGAGYIGSHMVYVLLREGIDVVVWDDFSTGHLGALEALKKMDLGGDLNWEKINLMDREAVDSGFEKAGVLDGVFHFAAYCSVDESMSDPGKYFGANVQGTLNVLDGLGGNAGSVGGARFVFSSTCSVYGEGQYFPIDENHPTAPTNPYGESKLMAEKLIEWYGKLKGVNYAILRYFNVCGAQEDGVIGDAKNPSVHLVQNVVRGAMGIEEFYLTCPEVDTPDGTPIRDYVDVLDLCEAHLKAWEWMGKMSEVSGEIFNLGNGNGVSVKEIITAVENEMGEKLEVKDSAGKKRKGEYAKVFADISKVQEILGWEPKRGIKDSVESLVKWYRRRPNGF